MKQEKQCEHRSFEAFQGHWICSFCKEVFSAEEVEQIMVERHQGFEDKVKGSQI